MGSGLLSFSLCLARTPSNDRSISSHACNGVSHSLSCSQLLVHGAAPLARPWPKCRNSSSRAVVVLICFGLTMSVGATQCICRSILTHPAFSLTGRKQKGSHLCGGGVKLNELELGPTPPTHLILHVLWRLSSLPPFAAWLFVLPWKV